MDNGALVDESTAFLQISHDRLVGILEVETGVVCDGVDESTGLVNWARRASRINKTSSVDASVIVFSESRSTMDNTCTISSRDEVLSNDLEATSLSELAEVLEQRSVGDALKLRSLSGLENLHLLELGLLDHILQPCLSNNVLLTSSHNLDSDVH